MYFNINTGVRTCRVGCMCAALVPSCLVGLFAQSYRFTSALRFQGLFPQGILLVSLCAALQKLLTQVFPDSVCFTLKYYFAKPLDVFELHGWFLANVKERFKSYKLAGIWQPGGQHNALPTTYTIVHENEKYWRLSGCQVSACVQYTGQAMDAENYKRFLIQAE